MMLRLQTWRIRSGLRMRAGGLAPRRARQTAAPSRLPRARVALLWRRPRRFGRRSDPARRAQALTLQFGLHLNLMLNMAAGTQPTREQIAGGPAGRVRDASAFDPADRETATQLKTWRDYLLGAATPASTRGSASVRTAGASPRAQAPALQFSHRLNVLLNMMSETRQIFQRFASVLPTGARAASVLDSGARDKTRTRLNTRRDVLLGIAEPEGTPRRFAVAARTFAAAGAARVSGGIAPTEMQSAKRRDRRSRPFGWPSAEQALSWPAASRTARRPISEISRRMFGRPVEGIAFIAHGRGTAETITPITLAWRRAPNGALAQDARTAPSASMTSRANLTHAVMPATSPRDMPSALNARLPRQNGTQLDSAMVNQLTHEVIRRIEQRMRVERERRGL